MTVDTINTRSATIAAGAANSGAVAITECHQIALWFPAAWTTASVGIQLSRDIAAPTTWHTLRDRLGEVLLPAAAGAVVVLEAGLLLPTAHWLRLVSGGSTPVNQGAERVIGITQRRF